MFCKLAVLAVACPALALPQAKPAASALASLKFPPLRQIQIPKILTAKLPNGMEVMLLENHELPLVRGTALVRTGNLFDPAEKIGLATLTGMVMRSGGTKAKSGDELDEQLENIAATVESDIEESAGTVSFSCLKENTREVLAAFVAILTAPEFREDKVELAKGQLRSGIARRNDEPSGIVSREFAGLLFGHDNSYGWDMQYATLDRIQRKDLIDFHRRYFFPANIILAVQGDFVAAEMKTALESSFAAWTPAQEKVPPFPPVKKRSAPGIYVATKKDVSQTSFAIGQFGGTLNEKDYPALEVMADILGGGFHSRLFQIVRSKLGYAYSVSADWGANYDHPGLFQITGSTKSASTADTFKVIREQTEKMRSSPVTSEELETAKQSVLNSFVFHFDTPSKTLNRLLLYRYFGYPEDFLFQYQKAIAAVTPADVQRVAKERLDPTAFTMLAVGNPADFGAPLTQLGLPIHDLDIAIPEPKPGAAPADAASLQRGKEEFEKMQAAVGGAEKLASVRDMTLTVQMQVVPAGGGLKVKQVNQWMAGSPARPALFRQDAAYPFGNVAAYFDGTSGWISLPQQGTGPMPELQRKQVADEMFRLFIPLLLSDRVESRTVNSIEGRLIVSGAAGEAVTLTADPKTGRPAKEEYQQAQPQGPPTAVALTITEYGEHDGIQLPSKWTIARNGDKYADGSLLEVKFNSGLKAETLGRQP